MSGAVAVALWVLAIVLLPAAPVLLAVESSGVEFIPSAVGVMSVQLTTASVGAMIARRLAGNAVGWIFLALGVGLGLALGTVAWAEVGLITEVGPLPGDDLAAWVGSWLFVPVIAGLPLLLLLLFPDGRFLSPRWRKAGLAIGVIAALATTFTALRPGRIDPGIENPMAPDGAFGDLIELLDAIASGLVVPGFALAVAGLLVRFRRSRGIERQQLKWFTYVAALAAAALLGGIALPAPVSDYIFPLALIALAGLPVTAAIAILRYRLYDIDVVINRTLVYAGLTATLAAVYVGSVLLLQLVLSPGSDLAIAASTLAVAAVFRPARGRIQAAVDRRFSRSKYDAAHTIEAFSARLRNEIELDALNAELRSVVADTMRPADVSLWLRGMAP
jgi:hypothetical protein